MAHSSFPFVLSRFRVFVILWSVSITALTEVTNGTMSSAKRL